MQVIRRPFRKLWSARCRSQFNSGHTLNSYVVENFSPFI